MDFDVFQFMSRPKYGPALVNIIVRFVLQHKLKTSYLKLSRFEYINIKYIKNFNFKLASSTIAVVQFEKHMNSHLYVSYDKYL